MTPHMRYLLHNHPAFPGLLSKEDLHVLIERGTLARCDFCTDIHTARDHTVGEVIDDPSISRSRRTSRLERPSYREFRADEDLEVGDDEPIRLTQAIETTEYPLPSLVMPPKQAEEEDLDDDLSDEGEESSSPYNDSEWENLYFMAHPSWLSYWKPLILVLLLGTAAIYLRFIDEGWALMLGLCSFATLIVLAIARRSHDYIVTDERIEYVWGILGRSSKEVRICDIRSLNVSEKGFLGLLGLGSLEVSSASSAGIEVQFKHLRGAHKVKKIIRKLQREQSS
jgi:hypothetical protein